MRLETGAADALEHAFGGVDSLMNDVMEDAAEALIQVNKDREVKTKQLELY